MKLTLSDSEFIELVAAAERNGLAPAAYAADAALAAARNEAAPVASTLREALHALIHASGSAHRIRIGLERTIRVAEERGQAPEGLRFRAEECIRVMRRIDDAADRVRRSLS